MADSILSVTIRDREHPCAPYQSTRHSFRVQVFHCDGKPLFWKGVNFGPPGVLLQVRGEQGGVIHGQFRVPPGCYVVRGVATCNNVLTDWAWVDVCCDQTVCVDLVPPSIFQCIRRVIVALQIGTVEGDRPLIEIMPREVQVAVEALDAIAARLPRDLGLPVPPTAEEVRRAEEEQQGKEQDPEQGGRGDRQ